MIHERLDRVFYWLFAVCWLAVGWSAQIGGVLPQWPARPTWVLVNYLAAAACATHSLFFKPLTLRVATSTMVVAATARSVCSIIWPSNLPGLFVGGGAWGLVAFLVVHTHLAQRRRGCT